MEQQLRKIAERLRVELDEGESDRARKLAARALRIAEAVIFASGTPVSADALAAVLPAGSPPVADLMTALEKLYQDRGVRLVQTGDAWSFRTAQDLAFLVMREKPEQRKLSRAALETLAIVAYHQPVTRAEMEEIRGVAMSKGTLDLLLEIGWIRMRGRRRTPGKPVTYGTTDTFLSHFNLQSLGDLPGMEELKAAGLVDADTPPLPLPEALAQEDEIALGEDIFDEMAQERINADEAALDPEAKV